MTGKGKPPAREEDTGGAVDTLAGDSDQQQAATLISPPASTGDRAMPDMQRLLDMLGRDGRMGVLARIGGKSYGSVTAVEDAARVASGFDAKSGDVWMGVARLDAAVTRGRGKAEDTRALTTLPVDIDVKPGGMPTWDAAWAVVNALTTILDAEPACIVNSGHGLQPWFVLDPDDPSWTCDSSDDPRWAAMVSVVRRWQRLVKHIAALNDGNADHVGDLARVLRVPGSTNYKDPNNPVPVTVERWGVGTPVSMERVLEVLDEYAVPETPEGSETLGEVIAPRSGWSWAEQTCTYVTAMIEGWAADRPTARHPWLVAQATRLASAHRNGCITEPDHAHAETALREAFTALLRAGGTGTPRDATTDEVDDALAWGIRRAESKTETQIRDELGNHNHEPRLTEFVIAEAPTIEEAVFGHTPELAWIREHARHRMVSPWALLACMIGIANAGTDPAVTIPAFINGSASLNTGIVLASASGGGKSGTMQVAEEALANWADRQAIEFLDPSSGEGILALFVAPKKGGGSEQIRRKVVSVFDEIGRIGAQADRSGSTFMANLRTAITGGRLSNHAADPSRQRHLARGTYRWTVLIGAQPRTSEILLNPVEADAGTPQRFLWAPAFDHAADPEAPNPGENPFTHLRLPVHEPHITYPDTVRDHVRAAHAARQRGEGSNLDGHAMLTRLKVAASLAVLHGSTHVTSDLWDLSEHVMRVSDRTRDWVQKQAAEQRRAEIQRQGHVIATREIAREETRIEQAARVVARYVHRNPDGVTRQQLRDACGRYRDVRAAAIQAAVDARWIRVDDSSQRYLPGEVQP